MLSQDSEQDEREQIQDDIDRLQLALQEEGEYEDSEDENALHINQDYVPSYDGTGSLHAMPGPSGINTYDQEEGEEGDEVGELQMDIGDLPQMMGDDGEIVINPETCLALNRAYQEILLDLLRKIEISLQDNRSKQSSLEEELTAKSSKKNASSSDPHSVIKPLTWFGVPFFRDANGRHAPQNEDVRLKQTLGEIRQDNITPVLWYQVQRDLLTEAVQREAQEKLIRPLMNKKEIEAEKHLLADKNNKTEVKNEIEATLEEIDMQIEAIRHYSLEKLLEQLDPDNIDWMKISNIDFLGKHSPEDCKKFWVNVLQPKINKDKWVPEERDLLQELVIKHEMRNWDVIAKELGTNRSAYQCLQYYQQNLNEHFSSREWKEEEDELLKEVVDNCRLSSRISWNQVCYFIEGRNWRQCQRRWLQIDPSTKRGRWSAEEDCLLLSAVHLHGDNNWKLIKEMVPGRSAYQCRDRYTNCLNPSLKPPTVWTYEEDKKLLQLASKYAVGDSSCISWTKVAAEMEGRTDHMVLSRYKRLKSWKVRSDWLKTQDADTKSYLGALFSKEGQRGDSAAPITDFDVSRLGAFASSVQRNDYLKQIRDEQAGDIVVPRPPLSYRYTSRNMEQLWQRKMQLKRLVVDHLEKTMSKSTTSKDKMLIPSKTAKEFVPFDKLNKKQQLEMDGLFRDKDPSSVTVSEMLAITKKFKFNRSEAYQKRLRRNDRDYRIENKMADVVQMKNYMSMFTRTSAGRPKKFYIFHPYGKPPRNEVPENVAQLTSVSTTLMLSALEVNGHKALQNAMRKPENQMSPSEKENFIMLKKLFPPMPASMKAQLAANSLQGQKVISSSKAVQGPSSAPGAVTKAVDSLQGLKVSVTKTVPQPSTGDRGSQSKGAKTVTIVKSTTPQGTVPQIGIQKSSAAVSGKTPTSSPQITVLRTAASSGSQGLHRQTVVSQTQKSAGSVLLGPGQQVVKTVSRIDPKSIQARTGCVSVSTPTASSSVITNQGASVQPPRVVVVQKHGAPTPSNIPLLPPGVKSLEGFAGLLVQRQLLIASAGAMYNDKYYQYQTKKRSSLILSQDKEVKEDRNLIKNVLDSFKNSSSAAVVRGAKQINKSSFTRDNSENTSLKDPLSGIRSTPDFQLLQKRFEGLFTWPALLSTVEVGDITSKQGVCKPISGKKARMDHRKKVLASRPAEPEPDIDMGDLLAAGEKVFVTKVKRALGKAKKKRYPCANGKFFYRNQFIDKEHRQQMARKRVVARRLNKELREQGISVNDLHAKSKPLKKRLHPTRQSSRLAQKVNVVMPEPPPASMPEPEVHIENLDTSVEVKLENFNQSPDSGQGLMKEKIQNQRVTGTVQSQEQLPNPGIFSPYILGQDNVIQDGNPTGSENSRGVQDHGENSTVVRKDKLEPVVKGKHSLNVTSSEITSVVELSATSSEQNSPGPSASKKMRTEKMVNSNGDPIDVDREHHTDDVTLIQSNSTTPIQEAGGWTPSTAGPVKSTPVSVPRGIRLQSATTTGPFTVFPGMGTPTHQKPSPVHFKSSPVAIGGLSPMTTVSASNVATPFTHPEFAGHVLFAIPVDQLARSSTTMAPGAANQEGVFPVTLLINANNLPFTSPVRTSENAESPSSTNQSTTNQTTESSTSNQLAESVMATQTIESSAANQNTNENIVAEPDG